MTVNLGDLLKFWEEQAGMGKVAIETCERRLAELRQMEAHAVGLINAIRTTMEATETMRQMERGEA